MTQLAWLNKKLGAESSANYNIYIMPSVRNMTNLKTMYLIYF